MIYQKILVLILIHSIICNYIFDDYKSPNDDDESLKKVSSFEELDEIMSNSQWSKTWKMAKQAMENKEYNELFKSEQKNENILDDDDDDILLGDSQSNECLLSETETSKILKEKYGIEDNSPKKEIRFIVGKCHPVVLVPGIYSTKLQVSINCTGLINEDYEIYKKIKFYCGSDVCNGEEKEQHNLFIVGAGGSFQIWKGDINKYSACLGYFLTFFNTKDVCAKNENNEEYVCNYSPHIKIGYYGSNDDSKDDGECGLNAIQNVVMTFMSFLDTFVNTGALQSYKPLIKELKKVGYIAGFSMGGIPNDYRRFLATNSFTTEALRYQIENLYENTGKKVVLIGHSFGTLTILNNLIMEKNKDLLPKIKKFIAIGPPFAGSTDLIDIFFHGLKLMKKTIKKLGITIEIEFDDFGKEIMSNTSPTVFELRPLPIVGKLFNNEEYKEFGEAIRERINLEKECENKECDSSTLKKGSEKFDNIFKGYFPSLTDEDCKYEPSLNKSSGYFNKKCFAEIFNVGDCPLIISKKENSNLSFENLDNYCGKNDDNFYYQTECDGNRKCVDEIYYTKAPYPFDKLSEKAQYFIDKWNEKYSDEFGSKKSMNDYITKEKFMEKTKKQIEYYKQISLTKELPIPPIDTDIVYGNFMPTTTSFILNENNFKEEGESYYKGGDGTVPNWSSLLTGLKWIYDMKKNNLNQKIRLIEFCSRLAKNSEYSYDATKDQKFAAISCDCINDSDNSYNNGSNCKHSLMIGDKKMMEYILSVLNDPKEGNDPTDDRVKAVKNFDSNVSYLNKCNEGLLSILHKE